MQILYTVIFFGRVYLSERQKERKKEGFFRAKTIKGKKINLLPKGVINKMCLFVVFFKQYSEKSRKKGVLYKFKTKKIRSEKKNFLVEF